MVECQIRVYAKHPGYNDALKIEGGMLEDSDSLLERLSSFLPSPGWRLAPRLGGKYAREWLRRHAPTDDAIEAAVNKKEIDEVGCRPNNLPSIPSRRSD